MYENVVCSCKLNFKRQVLESHLSGQWDLKYFQLNINNQLFTFSPFFLRNSLDNWDNFPYL